MLDFFTLACLFFWLFTFFCVLGPIVVWITGEDDKEIPSNGPKDDAIKGSVTQGTMRSSISEW